MTCAGTASFRMKFMLRSRCKLLKSQIRLSCVAGAVIQFRVQVIHTISTNIRVDLTGRDDHSDVTVLIGELRNIHTNYQLGQIWAGTRQVFPTLELHEGRLVTLRSVAGG